jgi:chromosome segregation protein
MRIQRIEIFGFKSFSGRTVLKFEDGITGVVGPNGCGKSNLVDAIRWVMGEQSAKHLRGRSMEDVIFCGSERQAPTGMAEVSLTFLNDRPSEVPGPFRAFSEITVQRRLYRSGESEYLINKAPCRLLDITELFLGSGVGVRAYSIIEQGRVGLIVNAKPEDRRAMLEEAAGVSKYKARRKAAERRIESAEQNMQRVSDVVRELHGQLEGLERQARKATRYRELKGRLREIELRLASHRWSQMAAASGKVSSELVQLQAEDSSASGRVQEIEDLVRAGRGEVVLLDANRESLTARIHEVDKGLAQEGQAVAFSKHELERWARQETELQIELKGRAGRVTALGDERARFTIEERELSSMLQVEVTQLARAEQRAADLDLSVGELQTRLEGHRDARATVRGEIAAAESLLVGLTAQRADRNERIWESQREAAEFEARHASLDHERGLLAADVDRARQLSLQLEGEREGVDRALADARTHLAVQELGLERSREELSARRSRLQSLQEIQRNYEGYAQGVRAVMLQREDAEAGLGGILGLVADLIRAPREIEGAIEAVLGEVLQQVVVQGQAAALAAATFLDSASLGRGTFLPMDALVSPALPAAVPTGPDVVGRAVDLVDVAPEYASLAGVLLGNVLIVRHLTEALRLQASGYAGTLVTLQGEVLWESGALSAGTREGPGQGELQKRREISELEGLVAELAAGAATAQVAVGEARVRVERLGVEARKVSEGAHGSQIGLAHRLKDLQRLEEMLAQLRLQEEGAQRTMAGHQAVLQESEREAVALEAALEVSRQRDLLEAGAVGSRLGELGKLEEERVGVAALQMALKVKVAELRERVRSQTGQALRLEALLEDASRGASEIAAELAQGQAHAVDTAREVAAGQERLVALGLVLEEERTRLVTAQGLGELAVAEVARLESDLEALRARQHQVRSSLGDLQLRAQEISLQSTHLSESMLERHGVDLGQEASRFDGLPEPGEAEEQKLEALKAGLARMGEINLTAVEECESIRQRHDSLVEQKADLERSVLQLREAISRINRTSQKRFKETFALVNQRFSEIFPRVFSGGQASLVMTDASGDSGEEGIDIVAQPPGKRLQSIGLLSGGEKALTAVALVFAIFLIKPTPFCLLDEVDAPLDEGNVGRFGDLVRELSQMSQFILITHNKKTMELADTLYGITMEDPGCSKLVSVRLGPGRREPVAA